MRLFVNSRLYERVKHAAQSSVGIHPCIFFTLLMLVCVSCQNQPENIAIENTPVVIETASAIIAGEPVVVIVRGEGDRAVDLVWRDGYATRRFVVEMRDGMGSTTFVETSTAGVATISADGVFTTLNVLAGAPIEPITPLVAPKTLVVGGDETSMGVVVPFDAFGNLVQNGTAITYTVRRPDETQARLPTTIQYGVGWRDIGSGWTAGETAVVAEVGTANSSSAAVREVPKAVRQIELADMDTTFRADGRTRISLQTEPLHDRFGNLLADGLIVEFVVLGEKSTSRLTGIVIGGVAETTLLAPTDPQKMRVTARIGDRMSAPLTLEFTQYVRPFAMTLQADETQNALIVASETLQNGAIVPDGSIGRILLVQDGRLVREISAETTQGRITETIYLSDPLDGTYTVFLTVGGQTAKAELEIR